MVNSNCRANYQVCQADGYQKPQWHRLVWNNIVYYQLFRRKKSMLYFCAPPGKEKYRSLFTVKLDAFEFYFMISFVER